MKYWKITNNQKANIKIAICTASDKSAGVLLKPGQFCLSKQQMTKMLDAQLKRGFVTLEKDYNNEYDLETGIAIDPEFISEKKAIEKVMEYKATK